MLSVVIILLYLEKVSSLEYEFKNSSGNWCTPVSIAAYECSWVHEDFCRLLETEEWCRLVPWSP